MESCGKCKTAAKLPRERALAGCLRIAQCASRMPVAKTRTVAMADIATNASVHVNAAKRRSGPGRLNPNIAPIVEGIQNTAPAIVEPIKNRGNGQ